MILEEREDSFKKMNAFLSAVSHVILLTRLRNAYSSFLDVDAIVC
jgi:hypothetical protein